MDISIVSTQFVDLVKKYSKWREIKTLSPDEIQILFDTVSAAGFNPNEIVPGWLHGRYRSQDGYTGRTYSINGFCPFKVINQEGEDDYFATGWLDCALRKVYNYFSPHGLNDKNTIIEIIGDEMIRSVPLLPIQLTTEGDFLTEYPPSPLNTSYEYFVDHARDEHSLISCVGVHEHCRGWMDRKRATRTHDAIICRSCHLRVLFPRKVQTYGDLRQALVSLSTA